MSTPITQEQESERLARVLSIIDSHVAVLNKERKKGSKDLVEYRKYMWEDAALFDRAELVQSENLALTQEAAVTDVGIRLKRLKMLAWSAYFGRVDFHECGTDRELPVYIGLHGLDDKDDILIYDWRAPISSMFYDYEVGPAGFTAPEGKIDGNLLLKRQYRIEDGRMVYMLDSSLTIGDEILRDALAKNTSDKMKQIVNSIQREQNAVIRSDGKKVLIVQGPAGSGKTSIAMHRAAYLLYRHRDHIGAGNLLIFSPNEVFADYISSVLPELGEENIREATFDDYARSLLGKKVFFETKAQQMEFVLSSARDSEYALRTASIAFKSSKEFLRILRAYVGRLARENVRFADITMYDRVILPAREVEKLYKEYCLERPIMAGITRLKDLVLSRVTYSTSKAERAIERQVDRVLIDRDPVRLYRKLFKDPAMIRRLAEGTDLPDKLHGICKLTYDSIRGKLNYEDVAPILLVKRLIEGEPRYANIKHLIIDEAQDYTPVHFELVRQLFGESSMTILGDPCQQINSYSGLEDFDELTGIFARDTHAVMNLTRSYRSSWEISEFARSILPGVDATDNIRRSGKKPVIVSTADKKQRLEMISAELGRLRADGMASVGVICKTADEAFRIYSKLMADHPVHLIESDSITFHHGLVVLPAYLAKGLEFDAVIIQDASDSIYSSDAERKLLYTACTRALHSLAVYFTGHASPLLAMDRGDLFEYRDASYS